MTKTQFQIAFGKAIRRPGHTLDAVARTTGVAITELKLLQADAIAMCDVSDAQKIAGYFETPLPDFLGVPELSGQVEIVALYNQLPQHLKAHYLAFQSARSES